MEHDLADELRLPIYPVVLGDGKRLFGETGGKTPMHLVSARTVGDSLALLTYQAAMAQQGIRRPERDVRLAFTDGRYPDGYVQVSSGTYAGPCPVRAAR